MHPVNRQIKPVALGSLCSLIVFFFSSGCAGRIESKHPSIVAEDAVLPASQVAIVSVKYAHEAYAAGGSVFIDARPAEEFAQHHIPGAISIPFEKLDDHYDRIGDLLLQAEEAIVYCSSRECDEAALLAQMLFEMGKTNIVQFAGGFDDWKQAGHPTEQSTHAGSFSGCR